MIASTAWRFVRLLTEQPGFGDANHARNAVADRYLVQCAALWIVSPITRAVDDREARALLGRTFRRQLVLDGTDRRLAFVCSKTDDISVREVAESLTDDAASAAIQTAATQLAVVEARLASRRAEVRTLRAEREATRSRLDGNASQTDALAAFSWRVLKRRLAEEQDGQRGGGDGDEQEPEDHRQRKRAADDPLAVEASSQAKRPRLDGGERAEGESSGSQERADANAADEHCVREHESETNDDENTPTGNHDDNIADSIMATYNGQASPEVEARLEAELLRLLSGRDALVAKLQSLLVDTERAEDECAELEMERAQLANERVALCVQLRNAFARQHIRKDFADGQRE